MLFSSLYYLLQVSESELEAELSPGCQVMFLICFFNREEIEVLKRDKEQACFDLEELGTQVGY